MQTLKSRLSSFSFPPITLPELFTRRLFWLYTGYTIIVFLVSLVFTFPHDLLIRRALQNLDRGPLPLRVQSAGVSPRKGYQLQGLRIGGLDDGQPPLLEFSSLWARPLWSEWFRGNFYAASLGAELYGGHMQGNLIYRDMGLNGAVVWQSVQLGRYRGLQMQLEEGQITGNVQGNLTFELRGAAFQQGQANGELAVEELRVEKARISGWPVPDLHFKQLKSKFRVTPGKVDLTEIAATGDLLIQGSGSVTLREPYGESLVNLRLTVAPGPQASDTIKAVLALLPKPAGGKPDAPVTVTGTLSHPKIR